MYEEDFIFGPLTWRQFVYVATGAGISVLAFLYLPDLLDIATALVAIGVGAKFAYDNKPTKIELEKLDSYLEVKKVTLGDAKFKSWLKKTIAEKNSYNSMRQERGSDPDVELERAIEILKENFKEETAKQTD